MNGERQREHHGGDGPGRAASPAGAGPAPGKQTLTMQLPGAGALAVQRKAGEAAQAPPEQAHEIAAQGVAGAGQALPHVDTIQRLFGAHDVRGVKAHVGGPAAAAAEQLGATAYATGDAVAFRGQPDLHTASHEAAHVVQQRRGVSLAGGLGQAGDHYERHADQVADLVSQGQSAEHLLGPPGPGAAGGAAVQRSAAGKPDLTIAAVSVDKPLVRIHTDTLSFQVTVANHGDTAAPKVPMWARLSRQQVPDDEHDVRKDQPEWAHLDARPLAPGEQRAYALGGKRMPGGTVGKWFPGVTADPGKIVDDGDRANDTRYAAEPITVTDAYGNGATDPALGWTPEAKAAAGKIDGERLPYGTPPTTWNSREILSKWTQIDGYNDLSQPLAHTDTDELRCGPTAAIASVILDGPAAVYRFAFGISNKGVARLNAALQADLSDARNVARAKDLSVANAMVIDTLTELADPQRTTYGTLSRLGHATKILMTSGKTDAATGYDMLEMVSAGGPSKAAGYGQVPDRATFEQALAALQVGQKYTVNVDSDVRPASRGSDPVKDHDSKELNHWVMVARVGQTGRVVLYDPYPREGQQLSFSTEPRFWQYFEGERGAWKGCVIASLSGAGVT